jgi:hypothetical protein
VVQRHPDVPEHSSAGECRRDCTTPEITLSGSQQMAAVTFPDETRFEAPGKIFGWLYARKVSEKQKRSADLRIVLRAVLTFSEVSLHANQLDPGKGIVYKSNVLITKIATIHVDRLRVR